MAPSMEAFVLILPSDWRIKQADEIEFILNGAVIEGGLVLSVRHGSDKNGRRQDFCLKEGQEVSVLISPPCSNLDKLKELGPQNRGTVIWTGSESTDLSIIELDNYYTSDLNCLKLPDENSIPAGYMDVFMTGIHRDHAHQFDARIFPGTSDTALNPENIMPNRIEANQKPLIKLQGFSGSAMWGDRTLYGIFAGTLNKNYRVISIASTLRLNQSFRECVRKKTNSKSKILDSSPSSSYYDPSALIYLHLFDSQLLSAYGIGSRHAQTNEYLKVCLSASYGYLYGPISFLWEGPLSQIVEPFDTLILKNELLLLDRHTNIEESIEHKQEIYSFLPDTHEVYFDDIKPETTDLYYKVRSDKRFKTSILLRPDINSWLVGLNPRKQEIVKEILDNAGSKAIVRGLFERDPIYGDELASEIRTIHRRISRSFTQKYIHEYKGCIITGVNVFQGVDSIVSPPHEIPFHLVYAVLEKLLRNFNFLKSVESPHFRKASLVRGSQAHQLFCHMLSSYIRTFFDSMTENRTMDHKSPEWRAEIAHSVYSLPVNDNDTWESMYEKGSIELAKLTKYRNERSLN